MASRIDQIIAKLDRANKHFAEFETRYEVFRKECPEIIASDGDPQMGDLVHHTIRVPEVPCDLRAIAGDALQSLRSTLDHVVWHLIEANGQEPKVGTSGFPIFDSLKEYETGKGRKVQGMRDIAAQCIDTTNPYKGGNQELWVLHRLNNIDKHRLLLALAVRPVAFLMPPSEREAIIAERRNKGLPIPIPVRIGVPVGAPLEAGETIVAIYRAYVNQNVGFFFDVAVKEAGVIEGTPFYMIFRTAEAEVSRIVGDLTRFL